MHAAPTQQRRWGLVLLAQVAVASYVPDGKLQYLVVLVEEMKSPLGLMDKAPDFQTEDCGFKSRRGCCCISTVWLCMAALLGARPW